MYLIGSDAMFKTFTKYATVMLMLGSSLGAASSTTMTDQALMKDRMFRDLEIVQDLFATSYAPGAWKKEHHGWDLDAAVAAAKDRVTFTENITDKHFHKIMRDLVASPQDYHVRVIFNSTEYAFLPFTVGGAEGRYFITYIDRDRLPQDSFPFNVGDELLTFGGRPVGTVVDGLKEEYWSGSAEQTEQRLAEEALTKRVGMRGHAVPKGPIMVKARCADGRVASRQLVWKYEAEVISTTAQHLRGIREQAATSYIFAEGMAAKGHAKKHGAAVRKLVDQLTMAVPVEQMSAEVAAASGGSPYTVGSRESFLPPLGTVLWQSSDDYPFHAYLCETPERKRVGVIRIPHYGGQDDEAQAFADVIQFFQGVSDMLVIDQLNNPGGYVFHVYALASTLSDQPLVAPKHRLRLSQDLLMDVVMAQRELSEIKDDDEARAVMGDSWQGYPMSYQTVQFFLSFCKFMRSQWDEGKVLSDPYHFYGVDAIHPHPAVRYTKPILVLINELDFSGGDFFPAILQDNGRATIMGTRTAGAGGVVTMQPVPSYFGVAAISQTVTIAERADNKPIEDLGVTPDILVEVTATDLQNDFCEYRQKVLDVVDKILDEDAASGSL